MPCVCVEDLPRSAPDQLRIAASSGFRVEPETLRVFAQPTRPVLVHSAVLSSTFLPVSSFHSFTQHRVS